MQLGTPPAPPLRVRHVLIEKSAPRTLRTTLPIGLLPAPECSNLRNEPSLLTALHVLSWQRPPLISAFLTSEAAFPLFAPAQTPTPHGARAPPERCQNVVAQRRPGTLAPNYTTFTRNKLTERCIPPLVTTRRYRSLVLGAPRGAPITTTAPGATSLPVDANATAALRGPATRTTLTRRRRPTPRLNGRLATTSTPPLPTAPVPRKSLRTPTALSTHTHIPDLELPEVRHSALTVPVEFTRITAPVPPEVYSCRSSRLYWARAWSADPCSGLTTPKSQHGACLKTMPPRARQANGERM